VKVQTGIFKRQSTILQQGFNGGRQVINTKFEKVINSATDVEQLIRPDPATSLAYVMDAVSLIRKNLDGDVQLIGFSGSPWTLATYMVEGESSKAFAKIKNMIYSEPQQPTCYSTNWQML
jgi:uroporphyrinogen-III decarboxylase